MARPDHPSNSHLVTHANIEANGMVAQNLFCAALKIPPTRAISKEDGCGKITSCSRKRGEVPGHAHRHQQHRRWTASIGIIREVAHIAHAYQVPFPRCVPFAENAWFIKTYEEDIATNQSPRSSEMFAYVDGFTISFKRMIWSIWVADSSLKTVPCLSKYPVSLCADEPADHQEGHPRMAAYREAAS